MVNAQPINKTEEEILKKVVFCQYTNILNSYGYWIHNPFKYTTPVLLAQIVLIFFATRAVSILLRPSHQTPVMAQIIGGIMIGPSFLGKKNQIPKLFSLESRYILRTFAEFGMILHVFMLGVQIDLRLARHIRRSAVIIGVSSCLFPVIFGLSTYHFIEQYSRVNVDSKKAILPVVGNGMTTVVAVTSVLQELNMLNSELGRLASSTAIVADLFGWTSNLIAGGVQDAKKKHLKPLFVFPVLFGYFSIVFFLLRPLTLWIVKQNSDGKSMKQSHFVTIICIVLGLSFVGDSLGQGSGFCVFAFGLSLPDGPPLGTELLQKLNSLISGFLLPMYCATGGARTELHLLKESSIRSLEIIIMMSYLGKFVGTLLPSLYFGMSFLTGSCLALLMCCRGIIEMALYSGWKDRKIVNSEVFAILVTSMVIVTGSATIIVGYMYDPARRYKLDERRSIFKSKQNNLRILVCINKEENVNPMISLLQISNPARNSPITAFVVQLMDLKGSVTAFLKPNHRQTDCIVTSSMHIINAFNQFQRCYFNGVVVQHLTAIAPYASMHDDICTFALDKRAAIIIVPFHMQWGVTGIVESSDLSIRALNKNVTCNAPCSVGILVHRGQIQDFQPVFSGQSLYHIVMLFIGGADDREALAYSKRMGGHPNISLTVVLLRSHDSSEGAMDIDNQEINELKSSSVAGNKIIFKEEVVTNGSETTQVIQSLGDYYDLFIVGKHHDPDSQVTLGLTEWTEYPELGIIGDMLVNSNDHFSVLVVQESKKLGRN